MNETSKITVVETRLSCDALRRMETGETVVFRLPPQEPQLSKAANSDKSLAYRLQRELRCRFTLSTDFDNARLTVTRLPLQRRGERRR